MRNITTLKHLACADPRFSLFADSQSFVVGATDQLNATSATVDFAGVTLTSGMRFRTIGKRLPDKNSARLVAKDNWHYVIADIIPDFKLVDDQTVIMILFNAIDDSGNNALESFALANNFTSAFFAYALVDDNLLSFRDIEGRTKFVQPAISLLDPISFKQ
jgi:hypothetical protein